MDIDLEEHEVSFETEPTTTVKYDAELFKKWFKAGERQGFLSIRPWLSAGKFVVDVGEVGTDGKVKGSTAVFVDAVKLSTFLQSVSNGSAPNLYPAIKGQTPSPESFVSFGGNKEKTIARVFKIHYWNNGQDASAFVWKCGHFEGSPTSTGAVKPDTTKPLSVNLIRISRQEMAEIAYRIHVCLVGYAARNAEWFNG
jgi:hypothetical protein